MTTSVMGIVSGSTVVLDSPVPALEGQRVRVVIEQPPTAATASDRNEGHGQGTGELAYDPPMARLIGRSIVSTSPDGTVELQFQGSEQFANRFGTIQGGMLAAMLDSALGIALLAMVGPCERVVTVEMSTRYFRPAKPGMITARASVLHRSTTLAHAQAELFDPQGVRLAHATGSLRIVSGGK